MNAAVPEEPAAPAAPAAPNTGPPGQERGIGFAIVMTIVTLGIYAIYWVYQSYSELKRHRGEGLNGILGVLLCLVVVGYFKLPQYVGRMYRAGERASSGQRSERVVAIGAMSARSSTSRRFRER